MNMKISPFALAALATLGGCGKSSPTLEAQTQASQNPGSLLQSPKVAPSSHANREPSGRSIAQPDLSIPLDRYVDLNAVSDGMALTYLVTARSAGLADVEKLNRLSPSYHTQQDAFKRQELAQSELPRINAELQRYSQQAYYALPITDFSSQAVALTNVSIGPYEAASRSFPIVGYGGRCWGGAVRNTQGAVLKLTGNGPPCSLRVDDEPVARAIEAARASNSLHIGGTAFLFVPTAENGAALGVVAHARVVLTGGASKTVLGSFDLRSSDS